MLTVARRDGSSRVGPSLVVATALGLMFIAGLEAAATVATRPLPFFDWWPLASLAVAQTCLYLALPLAFTALIGLLGSFDAWHSRPRRWLAVTTVLAITLAVGMHEALALYEPFRGYWPFVVALVGLALVLAAGLGSPIPLRFALRTPTRSAAIVLLLAAAAVAIRVANYRFEVGRYATLHLVALQLEYLAWCGALIVALVSRARPHRANRAMASAAVAVAIIASAGAMPRFVRDVTPAFVDASVLGGSRIIFHTFEETPGDQPMLDPAGPERFLRRSGFPELSPEFRLEDYDILFIGSDTTRFDRTSLHDPSLGSTPHLVRRAESALVFDRMYAPSSGTLHSLAAVFGMAYPSMTPLDSWKRAWCGRLREETETVAEVLSAAGYRTFWVGYRSQFHDALLGFDQGFDHVSLVTPSDDAKIIDRALEVLGEHLDAPDRYFGWIYLLSPHAPYRAHGYADLPTETGADRYLHEIRFVDDQLERIFVALEQADRLDRTIVIYFSDHGEEFREHGGTRHKTTVYREVLHVPLVVWIPGQPGRRITTVSSLSYLFPWLFGHASSPSLETAFRRQTTEVFGPMLRETNGAVVAELVGHDRMRSTLIYDDLKINYDFLSELVEVYEFDIDPEEQHDVAGSDPVRDALVQERITAYREVRRHAAAFVLEADVLTDAQIKRARKKAAKRKKRRERKRKRKRERERAESKQQRKLVPTTSAEPTSP